MKRGRGGDKSVLDDEDEHVTRMRGFKDLRIRGFKDTRIRGFEDSRIRGFEDSSKELVEEEEKDETEMEAVALLTIDRFYEDERCTLDEEGDLGWSGVCMEIGGRGGLGG